jgi:hypothetical protein
MRSCSTLSARCGKTSSRSVETHPSAAGWARQISTYSQVRAGSEHSLNTDWLRWDWRFGAGSESGIRSSVNGCEPFIRRTGRACDSIKVARQHPRIMPRQGI